MSKEDIEKMNNQLKLFYRADDAILRANYYNNLED